MLLINNVVNNSLIVFLLILLALLALLVLWVLLDLWVLWAGLHFKFVSATVLEVLDHRIESGTA